MSDKKTFTFRGLTFRIEADEAEEPARLMEIGHVFPCMETWASGSAYGNDRREAFTEALKEIYAIAVDHQIRCAKCRSYLLEDLLGEIGVTYRSVFPEGEPPPPSEETPADV